MREKITIFSKKKKKNLIMAFGSSEMERGIETTEGGILGETRITIQKHLRLNQIAVSRRRY